MPFVGGSDGIRGLTQLAQGEHCVPRSHMAALPRDCGRRRVHVRGLATPLACVWK